MNEDERKLIGKRLKERREINNFTLEQVANKIGKTFPTVAKYESGEIKNIDIMVISIIADMTDTDIDYLLLKSDSPNKNINNNNNKSIRIPVLGRIPAGVPIELIEDILDYEDISEDMLTGDREYFALKVKGNSMEPKYLDGDVLIVLKQNDCESGQDCIVMVNGDDGTFKRVFKSDNGITLQPLNNEYMPIFYSNEDIIKKPVRILGVVKEIRRSV